MGREMNLSDVPKNLCSDQNNISIIIKQTSIQYSYKNTNLWIHWVVTGYIDLCVSASSVSQGCK